MEPPVAPCPLLLSSKRAASQHPAVAAPPTTRAGCCSAPRPCSEPPGPCSGCLRAGPTSRGTRLPALPRRATSASGRVCHASPRGGRLCPHAGSPRGRLPPAPVGSGGRPDTPGLLSVSRRAGRRPGRLLCLAPRRLPGLLSASLRAGCAAPGAGSAKPRPAPAHHHAHGPRSWPPATPSPPSASLHRAGLPACVARLLSIALAAAGCIRLASAGVHPRPELGLPSPAPLGPASGLSVPAPPRRVLRAGSSPPGAPRRSSPPGPAS
nr:translation initiation factor IF-2-like [Aegilops tauschii subsp. strangulata]